MKEYKGVTTFVVKVASRCNLNCSYCYMYNMGDETYKNQPKKMNNSTIENFAKKLRSHIVKHSLKQVYVSFHGGEPLLLGDDNLIAAKEIIETIVGDKGRVNFTIQTNGVLLTDLIIENLVKNEIYIGISLDGMKHTHDKFRLDLKGNGSFDRIIEKFKIVKKQQNRLSLITVLNLDIDPIAYYHFLLNKEIDEINIILLEANHDKMPIGYSDRESMEKAIYGKWLATLFDTWVKEINNKRISINIFENILSLLMGNKQGDQMLGRGNNDVVTIETNGAIETVDIMRITESGITRNNLNVSKNEIDTLFEDDIFKNYYFAHNDLCNKCNACDFKEICGGGMYMHRFSSSNGFDNPSVYCQDLMFIISHINDYLEELIA